MRTKIVHDLSAGDPPETLAIGGREATDLAAREAAEDSQIAIEQALLAARGYADLRSRRYFTDLIVNAGDGQLDVLGHVLDSALQAIVLLKAQVDLQRDMIQALVDERPAEAGPFNYDSRADMSLGDLQRVLNLIETIKNDIPKPPEG